MPLRHLIDLAAAFVLSRCGICFISQRHPIDSAAGMALLRMRNTRSSACGMRLSPLRNAPSSACGTILSPLRNAPLSVAERPSFRCDTSPFPFLCLPFASSTKLTFRYFYQLLSAAYCFHLALLSTLCPLIFPRFLFLCFLAQYVKKVVKCLGVNAKIY